MQSFEKINSKVLKVLKSAVFLNPKALETFKTAIAVKLSDSNTWYTRLIGLDEVQNCQKRVVELQDKLLTAQDTRREIGLELAAIRTKSNELQDQIHKVNRQEDFQRFFDLMEEESDVLKKEQELATSFYNQDRLEREVFTAFTNTIRDSHEKQRAHSEYTKYLGIIFSILGSFLSFLYVTFHKSNVMQFLKEEIANFSCIIDKRLLKSEEVLKKTVSQLRNETSDLLNKIHDNNLRVAKAVKSGNPNLINKSLDDEYPIPSRSTVFLFGVFIGFLVVGILNAK